jgi:hypothetical protein
MVADNQPLERVGCYTFQLGLYIVIYHILHHISRFEYLNPSPKE